MFLTGHSRQVVVAALRAASQLVAVSLLIGAIVASLWFTATFVALMYAVATWTSARRVTERSNNWWVAVPITAGSLPVVGGLLVMGLVPGRGIAVIPVAGILYAHRSPAASGGATWLTKPSISEPSTRNGGARQDRVMGPSSAQATIPDVHRHDAEILWDYHHMHHVLRPADVGVGFGSHDPGVEMVAVDLFKQGLFSKVVFTGANSPATVDQLPRGEAVHYQEYVVENGVPADAVLIETAATNIGESIELTRGLLAAQGVPVNSVILLSRPYQQRRAFATCRKLWPEVDVQCASHPLGLDDHVAMIGDVKHLINVLVGETQRTVVYASRGYTIEQELPAEVKQAFQRLAYAGFTDDML